RGVASLMFLVCRTLADGLRLFLTAIALQQALGWDFAQCVLLITVATTIYATLGGVSSVVKNDCLQLVVYTVGAIIALWLILRAVPGGAAGVVEFGAETGRLRVFDFGLGLTGGVTFWSGLVGGAVLSLATHGVDHLMVQRYLCAGSQRKAAIALTVSGPVVAAQFAL
ncbi:MAG: transporter, partial [Actinomycetota bacterium]